MDPPTMSAIVDSAFSVPPDHSQLPDVEDLKTEAAILSGGGPSLKSKRRMLMGVTVVAVAAIIGISVAISGGGGGSSSSPSSLGSRAPPETLTNNKLSRHQEVQDFLSFYSEREDLERAGSPQFFASRWIADEDLRASDLPESTEYDDSFVFVQRYILAVLFFATGGSEWKFSAEFLTVKSECDWNLGLRADQAITPAGSDRWDMGAACNDDGEVNQIFLPGNYLDGELPDEIGLLLGMEHFSAYSNTISGGLPENLQYWSLLNFLNIEDNLLTGAVPDWISAFTKLEYFDLGDNQFSGPLPSFSALTSLKEVAINGNFLTGSVEVFNDNEALEALFLQDNGFDSELNGDLFWSLDNLKMLDMSSNKIGGALPGHFFTVETLDLHNNSIGGELPEIGSSGFPLTFLSLYDNDISGIIPDSLSSLQTLKHLDLSYNALTGALPESLNNLKELSYLFLGENPFTAGVFPNLWNMVKLEELSLKNTKRTGPIPSWVGDELSELILLDLHANGLDGELPDSLGALSKLAFLLLNQNELTGSIPESFSALGNLALVFLDKNRMTGDSSPICVGAPAISFMATDCKNEVTCACCDLCCNDNDASCNDAEVAANLDDGYERSQYVFSEDLVFYKDLDPSA